ncbi:hypothetical protein RSAG8_07090, partial [Rhizoctonia solani AG-8 WAC10335]
MKIISHQLTPYLIHFVVRVIPTNDVPYIDPPEKQPPVLDPVHRSATRVNHRHGAYPANLLHLRPIHFPRWTRIGTSPDRVHPPNDFRVPRAWLLLIYCAARFRSPLRGIKPMWESESHWPNASRDKQSD